jgi:N-acetyl sugar amidotransferase
VIGVSGGTDSTYACYLAVKHGLRPLVVHLDNSWNTELAIQNIENLVTRLGLDLHTHVIDWEEFRDLQIAFLKASVIDIELLTDHAILAAMFKTAARLGVRYVVQGCNHATEAVLPPAWYHLKTDWLNIKDIHARYGTRRIKTFPHVGYFEWLYLTKVRGMSTVSILDYVHYDKAAAKSTIMRELGWRDYGGKHHESFFTRFYQTYILPRKFAVDKRKAHFSTLICSGQMTRQAALDELAKEVPAAQLLQDKEYVLKKWRLSEEEFEAYMKTPPRPHTDFASYVTRHQRYAEYVFAAVRPLRRAWGRAVGPRMTATRAVVDSDVKHRGE